MSEELGCQNYPSLKTFYEDRPKTGRLCDFTGIVHDRGHAEPCRDCTSIVIGSASIPPSDTAVCPRRIMQRMRYEVDSRGFEAVDVWLAMLEPCYVGVNPVLCAALNGSQSGVLSLY